MSESVSRLRQQAVRFQDAGLPTRTRYSAAFREQVLAVAREQRNRGLSVARIARELGLKAKTLAIWLRSSPKAAVRRVVVTPEAAPRREAMPVVVSAGGWRIEGLDLEGVVRLLRALA